MKIKSVICCVLASSMLFFSGCEKEPEEKVMNTETSRIVMDNFINQDEYIITIIYEGMNYELTYAKSGDKEYLGTMVGNLLSKIIRQGDKTYYFDVVGSGKMRRIENDTTDINLALTMLNTIYNQTVVNGTLTKTIDIGQGMGRVVYDYYTYTDEETGDVIEWRTAIRDDVLVQAERISDKKIFNFEYPLMDEELFEFPSDYVLVDDEGNELQTDSEGNIIGIDIPAENDETSEQQTSSSETSVSETEITETSAEQESN